MMMEGWSEYRGGNYFNPQIVLLNFWNINGTVEQ